MKLQKNFIWGEGKAPLIHYELNCTWILNEIKPCIVWTQIFYRIMARVWMRPYDAWIAGIYILYFTIKLAWEGYNMIKGKLCIPFLWLLLLYYLYRNNGLLAKDKYISVNFHYSSKQVKLIWKMINFKLTSTFQI